MKPFEIPAGTTVESLITEVLPKEHARFVPSSTSADVAAVVRIAGAGDFTVRARGPVLDVERGESAARSLWIASDRASVEAILKDAEGPGEPLPELPDGAPFVALSDPRVWSRMALVEGSIHASVDFHGATLWVAFGGGRRAKTIDPERTDVRITVPFSLFRALLDGKTRPEEAIADATIDRKGSRLVAMQAALALAVLYPPR